MYAKSLLLTFALCASYVSAAPTKLVARQSPFGTCSNPTIIFADGLDGRNEFSFAPANKADFSQGSALNINIIANFICGQLGSACKAGQAAVDACRAGQQAASGLQGQAAADAFNSAINGAGAGGAANNNVGQQQQQNPQQQNQNQNQQQNNDQQNANANAGTGGNLQQFNGQLGGPPPAVNAGGRGFQTNGADFLNVGAALGRSCDVQHNACANAANSCADFSVGDCDAQLSQCRALI